LSIHSVQFFFVMFIRIYVVFVLFRILFLQRTAFISVQPDRIYLPIYWINLDSAVSRRHSMEKKIRSATRIRAITAQQAETMYGEKYKQISFFHDKSGDTIWLQHFYNNYTYKELATCLSHVKAIQRAYDDGNNIALILEDDAIINPAFNIETVISVAPKNWETLQLYVHHTKIVFRNNRIDDPFVNWKVGNWGATAYIINKQGMEKILSMYHNNMIHFDRPVVVADEFIYYYTNSYTCTFPFVTTSGQESQIQNDNINYDKINVLTKQRAKGRSMVLKPFLKPMSINIVTAFGENFMQDVTYLNTWHNGEIYWNIIGKCPEFILPENAVCIKSVDDLRLTDYVLFKDKDIVLTGFAWQTFLSKSSSAIISGVLYENKDNNMIFRQMQQNDKGENIVGRINITRNSFFEYRTWKVGSEDISKTQNRGAFTSISPFRVDVVRNSFALVQGKFALWFMNQFDQLDGFEYSWCGAAADWSKKIPCQIVPLAIRQTDSRDTTNIHSEKYKHWMAYSLPFRNKYMRLRFFKYNLFDDKHNAYNVFRSFSFNDFRPMYEIASYDDKILSYRTFMSPVVVHKYKWIMFSTQKVVSSRQKRFIRRILGCGDGGNNPQKENDGCFTFLRDYNKNEVSKMMSDPSWTKSIFVREPFEKVLSSYLFVKKYNYTNEWLNMNTHNFSQFLHEIIPQNPHDPHFEPQYERIDKKWWPYINFNGTVDNFSNDFEKLLRKIGLWDEYGKSGWGEDGLQPITTNTAKHATNAIEKMNKYYTPELKGYVSKYYKDDFTLYYEIKVNLL